MTLEEVAIALALLLALVFVLGCRDTNEDGGGDGGGDGVGGGDGGGGVGLRRLSFLLLELNTIGRNKEFCFSINPKLQMAEKP